MLVAEYKLHYRQNSIAEKVTGINQYAFVRGISKNFKQYFTTPQNFGFGEFFYYMKKYKYHEN